MERVLITGSKGVIGRILMKRLKEYELFGIDVFNVKEKGYFKADISNFEELKSVFEKIGKIDYINQC